MTIWKIMKAVLQTFIFQLWQIGFKLITEELVGDSQRLSNIIDSSLRCSKSLPIGILDGAISNDKYTEAIKNYGIDDLANNEIIEKLEKWNKIMYTVIATYPNTNDQIQIPRNSDLFVQKVDDSIKDQVCELYFGF